jgi:hypothetical protein
LISDFFFSSKFAFQEKVKFQRIVSDCPLNVFYFSWTTSGLAWQTNQSQRRQSCILVLM